MSTEQDIKNAGAVVTVVGELVKVAKDDPQVKEAAHNIGKTAVMVTAAINNLLLPIAAFNYSFEKARNYFQNFFAADMAPHVQSIPPESIIDPKASLAGPALQGLAFSHEEGELKNMYLKLLATAMDERVAHSAHPAFVEVIKQLTSSEARLVSALLQDPAPIAEIRVQVETGGFLTRVRHVMNLVDAASEQPSEEPGFSVYLDNWVRLGMLNVAYDEHFTDESRYDFAKSRPEYLRVENSLKEGHKIDIRKGIVRPTSFGLAFAAAVGATKQVDN